MRIKYLITRDKVRKALKDMKNGKTPGEDEVLTEVLKVEGLTEVLKVEGLTEGHSMQTAC